MMKIVYYGPGLSGKTESLVTLQRSIPGARLKSVARKTDRELILTAQLTTLEGSSIEVFLHTEPG
jgi:hypothetical protein